MRMPPVMLGLAEAVVGQARGGGDLGQGAASGAA
jgi:hypothetical protein